MYSFKYCLFDDFTETSIAEINKKEFLKWVDEQKKNKTWKQYSESE